jgi:hypothetical protein
MTGTGNFGLGYRTLNALTSASDNLAIGNDALRLATTFNNSIAIGNGALDAVTTTNTFDNSIAIGKNALGAMTSSANLRSSLAIGDLSQQSANNPAGLGGNTSVGGSSLGGLTTGYLNDMFGASAGLGLSTGHSNSGFGATALSGFSTTGAATLNVAMGFAAISAVHGSSAKNVAIGYQALRQFTSAALDDNVAIGYQSRFIASSHAPGARIIAMGSGSLKQALTGADGIGIGANITFPSTSGASQLAIGSGSSSNIWAYSSVTGSVRNWTLSGTTTTLGGNTASALLEVTGTGGGFLMPKGTNTEMQAIATPAQGLQFYNTDSLSIFNYNGTTWKPIDKSDFTENVLTGADVTMTTLSTWYTGATITLPAGTWVITGQISMTGSVAATTQYAARIHDGTVAVSSGNVVVSNAANRMTSLFLHRIVTISSNTTYTIQGAQNQNSGAITYQSNYLTQSGATLISAHRIR